MQKLLYAHKPPYTIDSIYIGGIKALLANGADVNTKNERGETPLHVAACTGFYDLVKLLLEGGASANVKNIKGETPLHIATRTYHIYILRLLLLNADVDISIRNKDNETPLHIAVRTTDINITGLSSDATAGEMPLDTFATSSYLDGIKLLLIKGATLGDETKASPLHFAAILGYTDVIQVLVERGRDVNIGDKFGDTPLHKAVYLIVKKKENSMKRKGSARIPKWLRRYKLPYVLDSTYISVIKVLLTNGADVCRENNHRETPLSLATQKGHFDVCELLRQTGTDVNKIDRRK